MNFHQLKAELIHFFHFQNYAVVIMSLVNYELFCVNTMLIIFCSIGGLMQNVLNSYGILSNSTDRHIIDIRKTFMFWVFVTHSRFLKLIYVNDYPIEILIWYYYTMMYLWNILQDECKHIEIFIWFVLFAFENIIRM